MYLERLQQCHSSTSCPRRWIYSFRTFTANEETFQSYSTFTTNYKAPQAYENLLVNATKIRGRATKAFEWREPYEAALVSDHKFLGVMRVEYT